MAGSGQHRATVTIASRTQAAQADLAKMQAKLQRAELAANRLGTSAAKTATKVSMLGRAAKTARAGFDGAKSLGMGVVVAAVALDRMAERSIEVSNVYKKLTISVDAASDAVSWQVDQLVLAKNAAKLNSQGIMDSTADYAEYAGIIATAADAHGVDLEQALNSTTKAILKGNSRGLEALGIYVDMTHEVDELAKATNRSTVEVELWERQQIVTNAVMKQGAQQAFAYGGTVEDAAHGFAALKNKGIKELDDLSDKIFDIRKNTQDLGDDIHDRVIARLEQVGISAERAELGFYRIAQAAKAASLASRGFFADAAEEAGKLGVSLEDHASAAEKERRAEGARRDEERRQKMGMDALRAATKIQIETEQKIRQIRKPRGKGKGAERETYDEEKLEIARMERKIELIKLLDAGTWKLASAERERYQLLSDLATKQGDVDKQEKITQERAIELHNQRKEREKEQIAKTEARAEIDLAAYQAEQEYDAARIEGQLAFAETAQAQHDLGMQIAEIEHESNLRELQVRRDILDARFPEDELERLELQREMQQIDHEQRMLMVDSENEKRIASHELKVELAAEEQRIRDRTRAQIGASIAATSSMMQSGADVAEMAANSESSSAQKAARIFMAAKGGMAIAQGVFDVAAAASAFASYRYAKGIALIASSTANFVAGAKLLSGNVGHGASSAASAAAATPAANDGPGTFPATDTQGSSDGPASLPPSVPSGETGGTGGQTGGSGSNGGAAIVINGDIVGDITDSWAQKLGKKLDRQGNTKAIAS